MALSDICAISPLVELILISSGPQFPHQENRTHGSALKTNSLISWLICNLNVQSLDSIVKYLHLSAHSWKRTKACGLWYVCICELKCSIYLASGPQAGSVCGYSTNHSLNDGGSLKKDVPLGEIMRSFCLVAHLSQDFISVCQPAKKEKAATD